MRRGVLAFVAGTIFGAVSVTAIQEVRESAAVARLRRMTEQCEVWRDLAGEYESELRAREKANEAASVHPD